MGRICPGIGGIRGAELSITIVETGGVSNAHPLGSNLLETLKLKLNVADPLQDVTTEGHGARSEYTGYRERLEYINLQVLEEPKVS